MIHWKRLLWRGIKDRLNIGSNGDKLYIHAEREQRIAEPEGLMDWREYEQII